MLVRFTPVHVYNSLCLLYDNMIQCCVNAAGNIGRSIIIARLVYLSVQYDVLNHIRYVFASRMIIM